jgi:hypothetical protein
VAPVVAYQPQSVRTTFFRPALPSVPAPTLQRAAYLPPAQQVIENTVRPVSVSTSVNAGWEPATTR